MQQVTSQLGIAAPATPVGFPNPAAIGGFPIAVSQSPAAVSAKHKIFVI